MDPTHHSLSAAWGRRPQAQRKDLTTFPQNEWRRDHCFRQETQAHRREGGFPSGNRACVPTALGNLSPGFPSQEMSDIINLVMEKSFSRPSISTQFSFLEIQKQTSPLDFKLGNGDRKQTRPRQQVAISDLCHWRAGQQQGDGGLPVPACLVVPEVRENTNRYETITTSDE